MWRNVARETFNSNWQAHRARPALPCAITIAIILLGSWVIGHPAAGMVMAGGALPVGFGAFQRLGRSRRAPMFWGSICISLAALGSSLTPHTTPALFVMASLAGLACGLLAVLGPGTTWVGLQCGVAALVAGGYPSDVTGAFTRAGLILAGGMVQFAMVLGFWRIHRTSFEFSVADDPYEGVRPALQRILSQFTTTSPYLRFGIRLALLLGAGTLLVRHLGLANGYWVPMTSLLVLRTDAQQTIGRGIARIFGTLVGAGLATLLAISLHPNPLALGLFVVVFAWLCYSLISVNYGIFAASLTAYIAFLLGFGGLSTPATAWHRIAATALGGGLALLSYAPQLLRRKSEQGV